MALPHYNAFPRGTPSVQLQTQQTEDRETRLFEQKVESQQNRDNAIQANASAKAEVKAQEAMLRQAQLNLDFTRVTAPITGIAGIANPGIGDLVGPSDSQPLMTIYEVVVVKGDGKAETRLVKPGVREGSLCTRSMPIAAKWY